MPPVTQPPEGGEAPVEGVDPATPETLAPAAPVPDFGPIQARMDEMSTQQQQLVEQFGQMFEQLQPPEEEPVHYDDSGVLTEEGLDALVDSRVEGRLSERLSERDRRDAISERDNRWLDLIDEVPELADPKVANEWVQLAAEVVAPWGQQAVEHPAFVTIVEALYKGRRHDEIAAAQTPAQPGVVLESAQGAAQPSKGSDDEDWGDRIVKAAERLRPQI